MKTPVAEVNLDGDDEEVVLEEAIVEEDGGAAEPGEEIVDEDADPLDRLPARARVNADGSVTLPLAYPREIRIRKNGKERVERFDKLTVRRLNGADQRAIAQVSDDLVNVVAFSRACGIRQPVMNALYDKLDLADVSDLGSVLSSFLPSGRRTGR